jgi:serine/threonine-protein kinase
MPPAAGDTIEVGLSVNLSTIKQALGSLDIVDLDGLYERFRCERGGERVDDFLFYLFEHGRIGVGTLTRVADLGEITVTGVSELGARPVAPAGPPRGEAPREEAPRGEAPRGEDDGAADDTPETARYERIETIAQGGMGSVQLARDRDLQRFVAYKHIKSDRATDSGVLERFLFEAQVTAQLDHPNIVPIYSLDTDAPSDLGYAMKLVQGRTLAELVAQARTQALAGPLDEEHSLARFLEHFLKVCDAVHYAHSKGVLHRDLKPQNVLVGRYNEVYVVDWGIAKVLSHPDPDESGATRSGRDAGLDAGLIVDRGSRPPTQHGDLLGTPGYMSPEQVEGRVADIDARSEVFTLGLMLYEIATLRPAYAGGQLAQFMASMTNAQIGPITHVSSQITVPRELAAIVTKACERARDRRYPSVAALADDVRRYLRGEAVSARPDRPLERLARWMGRHREATLFAFLAVVLVSGAGAMWSVYRQQQTVLEAKVEQQRLAALVSTVAERAQRIERHFLGFEAAVEGLAAAALQLLTTGAPADGRFYTNSDYATPGRRPPDVVESRSYRIPVSLEWPVYKIAPDVAPDDVLALIRQVNPLRHYFRQKMFESVAGTTWIEDPTRVAREILDEGAALTWIYLGLEAGVHMAYPGKSGYPPEYDPRRRPWYVHSVDNRGTSWLPPYIDVAGRGLVLPCTRAVRRPDGTLLGVAGAEMTLAHLQRNLLDMSGFEGIRTTYLLDDAGRVVAGSGKQLGTFAVGTLVDSLSDLDFYPYPRVVDAVRRGESGQTSVGSPEGHTVVVYQRISSIRWYLVAEADPTRLPTPVGFAPGSTTGAR